MKISPAVCNFLQQYFDKIIVITLERATERQAHVRRQLDGLSFEFFYGVDKQTLDMDTVSRTGIYDDAKAKELNRYNKGMIVGHIACALSHRNVYEYILEKGYQRVLIFEDDVVPFFENMDQIAAAINELPADWEMVYFGYHKYESPTFRLKIKQAFYLLLSYLRILKWTPLMVRNLLPKPYSKHLLRAGFHDLLHGYAVSSSACKKLVAAQTPVVLNSDPLVTNLIMNGKLNAFITKPPFFTQLHYLKPGSPSFIHDL